MLIDEIKNIKNARRDLKNFGILIGVILLIIGGFLIWKMNPIYPVFLIFGFTLILLGFVAPIFLMPLYLPWMALAVVLGWILTRVLLSILFYLIFTPIGLIGRLTGKQFIERKWDSSQKTYWHYREKKPFDPKRYEKQF